MKVLKTTLVVLLLLAFGILLLTRQYPHSGDTRMQLALPAISASQTIKMPKDTAGHSGIPTVSGHTRPAAATHDLARNHEELWDSLNAFESASVRGFSARYSDALQFYNHGQLLWMQRHGYPMPADILAAELMSDEQLRELANTGDSPATAILLDRLITNASVLARELLAQGTDPFADPDFIPFMRDMMHYQRVLYASGTPFAGYVDARAQMEVFGSKTARAHYGDIVEIALQGLAYAYGRGDHLARNRALWLADEAGVDPAIFDHYLSYDSYYNSIWETMREPGNRISDPMPYGIDP